MQNSIAIKTPRQAVDYVYIAMPKANPAIIHLDNVGNPVPFGTDYSSVIIVKKRFGSCTPTENDILKAVGSRNILRENKVLLTDYIIIGDDGFYSFAEEKPFDL